MSAPSTAFVVLIAWILSMGLRGRFSCGGFRKWGYPKLAGWFVEDPNLKWMIWGYPHLWKPSNLFNRSVPLIAPFDAWMSQSLRSPFQVLAAHSEVLARQLQETQKARGSLWKMSPISMVVKLHKLQTLFQSDNKPTLLDHLGSLSDIFR